MPHRAACGEAAHRRPDLTDELASRILSFDDHWRAHALACNQHLPPGAARTLLKSPDPLVRRALAARAPALPEDGFALLAADPAADVRADLARNGRTPPAVLARLAADDDPVVRAELAQWWVESPEDVRRALLTDGDPLVRAAACSTYFRRIPHPVPPADLRPALLADPATRAGVVRHVTLEPALAKELAADPDDEVRTALAAHPGLPSEVRDALAGDASPLVRAEIFVRADTPDDLRAALHEELVTGDARAGVSFAVSEHDLMCGIALAGLRHRVLDWVVDAPSAHVASPYFCFRYSAALSPALPADAVDTLLDDEESRIRHAMAARTRDLSPDTAERLERRHRRDPKTRGRPADHTTFPTATLRRFAADPDPRIRSLAPRDPDLPPTLASRLAADDDVLVRQEAASHPNLPIAALRALLADDEEDERVIETAAASPALPVDVMEELLRSAAL
ncbi:hypothetical protein [Streptomyces sp. Tu 2975]|uniref:hypothetical protein n=1 Tax=Streptomyces sp. Tu 2975 TaxID=2676871 RepID=UPI001ABED3F2|nr:hypothetical protein [Streptomyces sp. Tu 2975]